MNEKVKILFFCMIFVAGRAFCQNTAQFRSRFNELGFYRLSLLKPVKKPNLALMHMENEKTASTFRSLKTTAIPQLISANYYSSNFGFFCKKELQVEKVTGIPFKFRLGSVQQCDWMEGKVNAVRIN